MKTINFELYRPAKADFIANLRRRNIKTLEQLSTELSLYCACFGLPVLIAMTFAHEEFPEFQSELEKKMEVVREFYGYEV